MQGSPPRFGKKYSAVFWALTADTVLTRCAEGMALSKSMLPKNKHELPKKELNFFAPLDLCSPKNVRNGYLETSRLSDILLQMNP